MINTIKTRLYLAVFDGKEDQPFQETDFLIRFYMRLFMFPAFQLGKINSINVT